MYLYFLYLTKNCIGLFRKLLLAAIAIREKKPVIFFFHAINTEELYPQILILHLRFLLDDPDSL